MRKSSIFIALVLLVAAFAISSCNGFETEEPIPTGDVVSDIPLEDIMSSLNESGEEEEGGVPTREVEHNVSLVIYGVEGDLIDLNPIAEDPDGDEIEIIFSEPFSDKGLWQTGEGDAGEHIVIVTASDGIDEAETRVLISLAPGNKAPKIECPEEVVVKETETINLDCNIYDERCIGVI